MNNSYITINQKKIGPDYPVYFIAELSANHHHNLDTAVELIHAAKEAGANAIKLQTYTADTLTLKCDNQYFQCAEGTIWEGKTLYDLYSEAYTPWEWHPKLMQVASELGLDCFSSPFDHSAVDFLEDLNVPAYKVASSELVDIPLLGAIGKTGKPIILSTGMSTLAELDEAVTTLRNAGATQIAILKCTAAYPTLPQEMNLKTISHLSEIFCVPVGLSDHSLSFIAAIVACSYGACIIEKHLILSRNEKGPDSTFSLEPAEFKEMVDAVGIAEKAKGKISYEPTDRELASRQKRRSLFVTKPMMKGDIFTAANVRSIRPGNGLHTRYYEEILGKRVSRKVTAGTPLSWDLVD